MDPRTRQRLAARPSPIATLLCGCRSGVDLARRLAELWKRAEKPEVVLLQEVDYQFSDRETCAWLDDDPEGKDVYVVQSLQDARGGRSVDENWMGFWCAVRAAREWGARRVVGVLPYLAYSRQDKPTRGRREPTTARLVADLCGAAGLSRLVTLEPHMDTLRGFYGFPVTALGSVELFSRAFRDVWGRDEVIAVAPDLGASRWVAAFARTLGLSSAFVSKHRPEPETAAVEEIIGDFSGKRVALVMDDMVGTGGTLEAVVELLVERKGIEEVHVGVTHCLGLPEARERLEALHRAGTLKRVVVTNSIPQAPEFLGLPYVHSLDVAELLALAVAAIHGGGLGPPGLP